MPIDEEELAKKLRLIEERKNEVKEEDRGPFHLRIQKNKAVLKEVERTQMLAFFNLIRRNKKLKHLEKDKVLHFADYWRGLLKGEFCSINSYLYKDRLDPRKELKEVLHG